MPKYKQSWRMPQGSALTLSRKDDDNLESKLGKFIEPQPDGCWLWRGRDDGKYAADPRVPSSQVHRWTYETLVGPIPKGHHLHHECGRRSCVNPAHLTPMTPSQHMAHHAALRKAS